MLYSSAQHQVPTSSEVEFVLGPRTRHVVQDPPWQTLRDNLHPFHPKNECEPQVGSDEFLGHLVLVLSHDVHVWLSCSLLPDIAFRLRRRREGSIPYRVFTFFAKTVDTVLGNSLSNKYRNTSICLHAMQRLAIVMFGARMPSCKGKDENFAGISIVFTPQRSLVRILRRPLQKVSPNREFLIPRERGPAYAEKG